MSDEASRWRERARDCRNLSRFAHNKEDADALGQMADDLDDEADRMDFEDHKSRN